MTIKHNIYYPILFVLFVWTSGLIAQSGHDGPDACFNELFKAGLRIADMGMDFPSAIAHFEAARACPDTGPDQDAAALQEIANANEKWRNKVQKQVDIAEAALKKVQEAQDSVLKAQLRAESAALAAKKAALGAQLSGAISEANRLALTANTETDEENEEDAIMLAYWAKVWSCDSTIADVERAFGNAAFLKRARRYSQIESGALGMHFDPNSSSHYIRSYSGDVYASDTNQPKLKQDRFSHDLLFDVKQDQILTVSSDATRTWNHDGTLLNSNQGAAHSVTQICFSPDGTDYVEAGRNGNLVLRAGGSQPVSMIGHNANITQIKYSDDGSRILSASLDKTVIIWDSKGNLIKKLNAHTGYIREASFSPNGLTILTASTDGLIIVWNNEGEEMARLENEGIVTSASFSPDQNHILSSSTDGAIRIWSLDGTVIYKSPEDDEWILSADYMKNDKILSRSLGGELVLWDANLSAKVVLDKSHRGAIDDIVISSDRFHFLTVGHDFTVKLWNAEGTELLSPPKFKAPVWAAGFSPDGTMLWACAGIGDETAWVCELPALIFEDLRDNIKPTPTAEQQSRFHIKLDPPCAH